MALIFPHFHLAITGKDQGAFPKDSASSPDGMAICFRMRFKTESPLDSNRGGAKAVRNVGPLFVLKPLGAMTPNMLAAHWANETLTDVKIDFVTSDDGGTTSTPYIQMELKNATIVSIEAHNGDKLDIPGVDTSTLFQYEEIGFHSEQITVKHVKSKGVAKYEWKNKSDS